MCARSWGTFWHPAQAGHPALPSIYSTKKLIARAPVSAPGWAPTWRCAITIRNFHINGSTRSDEVDNNKKFKKRFLILLLHCQLHRMAWPKNKNVFWIFCYCQLHRSELTHKIWKLRMVIADLHANLQPGALTGARAISFLVLYMLGSAGWPACAGCQNFP